MERRLTVLERIVRWLIAKLENLSEKLSDREWERGISFFPSGCEITRREIKK